MSNVLARLAAGISLAVACFCLVVPANAQQSPLIGSWTSHGMGPYGPDTITHFEFFPNGAVKMSGFKQGSPYYNGAGAIAFSEMGTYQFNGTILQYVFTSWAPAVGPNAVPRPPNLGVPAQVQIRFLNNDSFTTSDGASYYRGG